MGSLRNLTLSAVLCGALLAPGMAHAAASKEMQDLSRDVGELSDQMKTFEKSVNTRLDAIQALAQQSSDTANKTSASVSNLNSGLLQTMQTEMKTLRDQLSGITGLAVKIDNTSKDVSDLQSMVSQLVSTLNKQQSTLNDLLNQVKLMQAPPVAPPSGGVGMAAGPSGSGGSAPPPPASSIFKAATDDQNSGKYDLALSEYGDFLRLYPDDGNANKVQLQIGEIHYTQAKLDDAVRDFDTVIEKYGDGEAAVTSEAYYMKGMSLYKQKKMPAAAASFRDVIKKFPHSEDAPQAEKQLRSMGLSAGAVVPAAAKKKAH